MQLDVMASENGSRAKASYAEMVEVDVLGRSGSPEFIVATETSTGVRKMQASDSSIVETQSLLSAWRWWLPVALLTLTLALIFADPFAGGAEGLKT